jgi:hypothetical protein
MREPTRRGKRSLRKPRGAIPDSKALALIRASGILNPNAKLDRIMSLSGQIESKAQARGHIFIFRNVVLIGC